MMDLNDVKAGKYQLVSVRWDQITSKPGEPLDYIRHRRGDIVDLNAEDAKRLVAAGAVVKPGQLERSAAEKAKAAAETAAAQYRAVLAGLPEDVRREVAPTNATTTPAPAPTGEVDLSQSIDKIVEQVGDDKAKAKAALEAEQAKGDKARSTLVERLQAVLDAGNGS